MQTPATLNNAFWCDTDASADTAANGTKAFVVPDEATAMVSDDFVFEGPEKKLEVFFRLQPKAAHAAGFRSFEQPVWSELLTAARCTILHVQPSAAFDAYLLSESSLFVYPSRVILKTCGTTTLLLVLPRLLELAASLGATLEHVHYSHFRYKFPTLQVYPHTSFAVEQRCLESFLEGHIAGVHAKVIGDPHATCWYALCTEAPPTLTAEVSSEASAGVGEEPSLPVDVDDLFEIAMEGLPSAVCGVFFEGATPHDGARGRALARSMTAASGIGAVLDGVEIDDWAFEPCGYSMNGSRGAYYYTIHITPETDFSYASFETNDPAFRAPDRVAAVLGVFQPSSLTITLTSRRERCVLPAYALSGYHATLDEQVPLDHSGLVCVCCRSFAISAAGFASSDIAADANMAPTLAAKAVPASALSGLMDADATNSEASSEDTCELPPEAGLACATLTGGPRSP